MKIYLANTGSGTHYEELFTGLKLEIEKFNGKPHDYNAQWFREKKYACDFLLYIFDPLFDNLFSIAELIDDAIKYPEKTLFCLNDVCDKKSFSKHQKKSLLTTGKMVVNNKARCFEDVNAMLAFFRSVQFEHKKNQRQ
ncbi:MAG: hypothetical protein CSA05_01795 [Bacteroidia bacterium]|nr:MAG: hypothetical protein CSA05_01795 [Bacteroidia bacterium]